MNKNKIVLLEINSLSQLDIPNVFFVVGYEKYTSFSGVYLSYEELQRIDNKEKMFVLINALIHQKDLDDFKKEMDRLIPLGVNFIIQDLGALLYVRKHKLEKTKIIFNSYTLICNQDDFDAFEEEFDVDIALSNELNHEELMAVTKKEKAMITVFGKTPIYQSYRQIVPLFEEFRNVKIDREKELFIKEDTRPDMFPTIQNEYGTVVLRSEPLSRLEHIKEYKDFKYWYISSLFISDEELNRVLKELNNE